MHEGGTELAVAISAQVFEVPPLGRMGTTDDVVGIYNLLAAKAGSHITGQTITLDRGMTAGYSYQVLGRVLT